MAGLAEGGALADAGLVVNILIAVGTIGAASVALWLGVQARRASAAHTREARQKLNRQVICIYTPPQPGIGSSVEVVNASPEVVTRVVIQVRARAAAGQDPARPPAWQWRDQALTSDFSTVSYLLPGTREVREGAFWPQSSTGDDPADGRTPVPVDPSRVELELIWQDSYGDVWNKRTSSHEAFPTSWAAPWRDLRGPMPRWAWPEHWPPTEPARRRPPFEERAKMRIRSLKHWVERRLHWRTRR